MILFYGIFRNKGNKIPSIQINITIILRLIFDFIIVGAVFFDKKFERLYKDFLAKKFITILLSLIFDFIILIHIIINSKAGDN